MIRSYRIKRRRVQQELELLNYIPSSNNDIPTVQPEVQPKLNESAPNPSPESESDIYDFSDSFDNELISHVGSNQSDEEILNKQLLTSYTSNTTYSDNYCSIIKNEHSLRSLLSTWVVDCNVPHTTVNALLHTLRSHQCIHCLQALPIDTKTLLNSSSSKISNIRTIGLGKYYHFGLKEGIQRLTLYLELENIIKVVVGVDGLPLSKSSGSHFWPILVYIQPYIHHVFLVGLYHGHEKPNNSNDYLKDFIEEAKDLVNNGILLKNSIKKVIIHMFCTDAPAKSFILKTKGFYSCSRCTQDGKYINNRMCFPFKEGGFKKRTHEDYVNMTQELHHVSTLSDLIHVPGIDIVNSFSMDYMHLVFLGVVRKLINLWIHGPLRTRLLSWKIKQISSSLTNLKLFIPNDFARKPREIEFINRWKATELRQFLLYTGPIVLKNVVSKNVFDNFMALSIAMTLLLRPDKINNKLINYAENLLIYFVKTFQSIYGEHLVSHNKHGLLHICDDFRRFGPLDLCSCFPFENFMKTLKLMLRKHEKPLEQVIKRHKEKCKNEVFKTDFLQDVILSNEHCNGPLLEITVGSQYLRVEIQNKISINIKKTADKYVLTSHGDIVQVENISYSILTDEPVIIGYIFKNKQPLYNKPIQSTKLNIFILNDLSDNLMW